MEFANELIRDDNVVIEEMMLTVAMEGAVIVGEVAVDALVINEEIIEGKLTD